MITIYVIVAGEDVDGWKKISNQLRSLSVGSPILFPALDGRNLPISACEALSDSEFWAQEREAVGRFMSHVRAWEILAKEENSHVAIVEANTCILGLKSLENFEFPSDFDILFIKNVSSIAFDGTRVLSISQALIRLDVSVSSILSDGYILTNSGAQKLLAAVRKDLYFGHINGRLLRYATSKNELELLADAPSAKIIRDHHHWKRQPELGLIKGYMVLAIVNQRLMDPMNLSGLEAEDKLQNGLEPLSGPKLYDYLMMLETPDDLGLIEEVELPKLIPSKYPEFVVDLSGKKLNFQLPEEMSIHGSYLVCRENVLLFGSNNLITREGYWSCESRREKQAFLDYINLEFFDRMFPGKRPEVHYGTSKILRTSKLLDIDVEQLDTPLFLATPLEPPIWGRWIANVIPKVMLYKSVGFDRKLMCHVENKWQRELLNFLGVSDDRILPHDPGKTYICRDVMTMEYSEVDLTISTMEREYFYELAGKYKSHVPHCRRVFVSRLSRSRRNPAYRALQNEEALALMLEQFGFQLIEPELLPFEQQISVFAQATEVVFLGGSAVFNSVFCAPGSSILLIESSMNYIHSHAGLLGSLDHRYGIIFGREDPDDKSPYHKRWSLDLAYARRALAVFFNLDC